MTLVMTVVNRYGVWASTDHRLTEHPSGRVITDHSVKHVVIRCNDGGALVSYTGLGRVGPLDVSEWMRGILRGQTRTLDETLIDLREQATAKIGRQAISIGIPHAFLVGAFLGGNPWAAAIKNVQPPTTFSSGGIQPAFGTTAIQVKDSAVFIEGAGSAAVTKEDRNLLRKISSRKPRRSEEIMKLLGEVSCRAAESRRSGSQSVSRSCTVVYMPPTGDGVRQEWYGPEMDRQQARVEVSHLLFGIDLAEVVRPMHENFRALADGQINEEEFERMVEASARKSVQPRNRSTQPKE